MRIAELMSRYVEFIEPDVPVKEAAIMMGDLDVGALPVGTADDLKGVITDRDILYRVVATGLDCSAVRVADALSRPVVSCYEDDAVEAVMQRMASHHIRRMPVCDGSGKVIGWITLADLSRHLLVSSRMVQEALTELTAETSRELTQAVQSR